MDNICQKLDQYEKEGHVFALVKDDAMYNWIVVMKKTPNTVTDENKIINNPSPFLVKYMLFKANILEVVDIIDAQDESKVIKVIGDVISYSHINNKCEYSIGKVVTCNYIDIDNTYYVRYYMNYITPLTMVHSLTKN